MTAVNLEVVQNALEEGLIRGALIHEKSGLALPIEVITAEGENLLAIIQCQEDTLEKVHVGTKIRVELPKENSVVWVQGKVLECRADGDELVELEIGCLVAENRPRRMDVRIEEPCRICSVGGREEWMDTRALNISSAGSLVVSECCAKVGERVKVEFSLEGESYSLQAEVERRGVKVNGSISRTNASLKLLGLTPSEREKMTIFVLGEQARTKGGRR